MYVGSWGVVLTGGAAPPRAAVNFLFERSNEIVAADSGFDLALSYGVAPDFVVGDFDSVQNRVQLQKLNSDRVREFSHKKDETDTEIAVRFLREHGETNIAVVGGGGGRLDHLIAILSLFDRGASPALWITDDAFVYSIEDDLVLTGQAGKRVSFFPAGRTECAMKSSGLEWELDGLRWRHGDIGVSNKIISDRLRVSLLTGRLIMVGGLELLPGVFVER